MIWKRRDNRAVESAHVGRSADSDSPAASVLSVLLAQVSAGHGWAAVERLVDHLLGLDQRDDRGLAERALTQLRSAPRVVARLDEFSRRVLWHWDAHAPSSEDAARRVRQGTAGPIAVALASTHGDGRVREAAVRRMLDAPQPEWAPFLVLRTGDWVKPVRDRARAGVALLLADDPGGWLPAVLGTAAVTGGRRRGGFAYTQAVAALLAAPPQLREELVAAGDPALRRLVLDIGLGQGWWPPDVLLGLAVAESDLRVRLRAAEVVCRDAVWTGRIEVVRRLARHPSPPVRGTALTGLVRLGRHEEAAGWLDDWSALVRAIARDAARRAGVDALAHYRTAVTMSDPPDGAIAGPVETGGEADTAVLHDLLARPERRVRAQAVRGLRRMHAVPVEQVIPLLRDPSPAVVREATAALLPFTRAVPDQVGWDLLADPRVELRRAGYRLLAVRGLVQQLRAALLLATDRDARLAGRGVADTTRLARDAAAPAWRRLTLPPLKPTSGERADLTALIDRAAGALGDDATAMLHTWLAGPGNASWTVWRQDDNGNRYEVSRHHSRPEAESVAAGMEARGHKQTYWVAASE